MRILSSVARNKIRVSLVEEHLYDLVEVPCSRDRATVNDGELHSLVNCAKKLRK